MMSANRVGDWMEVRPITEILSTLDGDGALDAMPFMPEMAGYVGRRFRVVKSAHKTCDPAGRSDLRRLDDTVHLDTRCDGSAHDGCEARCLIFWKTAWLKPVRGPHARAHADVAPREAPELAALQAATRRTMPDGKTRYRCQVTEIAPASRVLPPSDMRQYYEDVATGNISFGGMIAEFATIVFKALRRRIAGRDVLGQAAVPKALDALNLQPGERVQVRDASEILATLDKEGKHRGLAIEHEMLRHCGKTYRVAARIHRIIDEKTGRMIRFANACVALEGVVCHGLDNRRRVFCPRSSPYYWREAWLRRVEA